MNNNTSPKKTTFWNFLKNNYIEIPIIQRDYAQGRKGKEELRKTFLVNLKAALDKKQELTLDFVYGSTSENNRLNPLDGQQRLTTLWLLHWYVAYKANVLTDDVITTFKKFTYETRVSSREFCERFADFKTQKPDNFDGTISDFIQQQTWFYSAWKQDPTIQSMLRMLSGTPNKDKNGQEIVDGLEELFANSTKEQFKKYWDILTEYGDNKCPINFYNLDLGKLELTDDLYIKMNARGEQLTSFENFKSDLVGYIKEQKKEAENPDKKWEEFLDPKDGIPIKMDTTWTNIFWKNQKNGKIDDIYFAFLNRFFLNEFICKKNSDNSNYDKTVKDIENDPTFKLLNGDDSNIIYQGFEKYKTCITEMSLNSLQKTLNNFAQVVKDKQFEVVNKILQPNWSKDVKVFDFISDYKDGKSITTFTRTQRVVFYAICKYFEKKEYEKTSLEQWMRVVWNLVENGNIDTIDKMIKNLRLIDELYTHSHDIYEFLAGESKIESDANKEQLKEEREKAKQILSPQVGSTLPEKPDSWDNSSDPWDWKYAIITAEKYKFFKGSIRFLFRNENGKYDWNNFDKKWENAQSFFNSDAPKLQGFVKYCSTYNDLKQILYDTRNSTWKTNLLNPKLFKVVHNFLSPEGKIEFTDKKKQSVYHDLTKTELLSNLRYHGDKVYGCHLRDNIHEEQIALMPDGATSERKKYVIANPRNEILSKALKDTKIATEHKIEVATEDNDKKYFFWGWDIYFTYPNSKDSESYLFRWTINNNICLMDKNEKIIIKTAIKSTDNFLGKLDSLILEKQTKNL